MLRGRQPGAKGLTFWVVPSLLTSDTQRIKGTSFSFWRCKFSAISSSWARRRSGSSILEQFAHSSHTRQARSCQLSLLQPERARQRNLSSLGVLARPTVERISEMLRGLGVAWIFIVCPGPKGAGPPDSARSVCEGCVRPSRASKRMVPQSHICSWQLNRISNMLSPLLPCKLPMDPATSSCLNVLNVNSCFGCLQMCTKGRLPSPHLCCCCLLRPSGARCRAHLRDYTASRLRVTTVTTHTAHDRARSMTWRGLGIWSLPLRPAESHKLFMLFQAADSEAEPSTSTATRMSPYVAPANDGTPGDVAAPARPCLLAWIHLWTPALCDLLCT